MIILEDLPLPCKLNQLYSPIITGRYPRIVLSKKARTLKNDLLQAIRDRIGTPEPITTDCYLNVRWHNATRHRHDIDGIIKQLLDVLTESGIIEDDSLIKSLTVELEQPRKPGGVSIQIGPYECPAYVEPEDPSYYI